MRNIIKKKMDIREALILIFIDLKGAAFDPIQRHDGNMLGITPGF